MTENYTIVKKGKRIGRTTKESQNEVKKTQKIIALKQRQNMRKKQKYRLQWLNRC